MTYYKNMLYLHSNIQKKNNESRFEDIFNLSFLPPFFFILVHLPSDGPITTICKFATTGSLFTKEAYSLSELKLSSSCALFIASNKTSIITISLEGKEFESCTTSISCFIPSFFNLISSLLTSLTLEGGKFSLLFSFSSCGRGGSHGY